MGSARAEVGLPVGHSPALPYDSKCREGQITANLPAADLGPAAVGAIRQLCGDLRRPGLWGQLERIPCGTAPRRGVLGLALERLRVRSLGGHQYLHPSSRFEHSLATLEREHPDAGTIFRFACLNQPVPRAMLPRVEDSTIAGLRRAGLLDDGDGVRLRVRLVPYADESYLADPLWMDDQASSQTKPSHVHWQTHLQVRFLLGLNPTIAGRSLLEVGCGTGLLSVRLAPILRHVHASDISARSVAYARANAVLHGATNLQASVSDLFSTVTGHFDLIVFNPWQPSVRSIDLIRRFLEQVGSFLAPDGRLLLVVSSVSDSSGEPFMRELDAHLAQCGLSAERHVVSSWSIAPGTLDSLNFLLVQRAAGRMPPVRIRPSLQAFRWRLRQNTLTRAC